MVSISLYWLIKWYVKRTNDGIHELGRAIYKMFIWRAKPDKSYINPYLIFFLGFLGMIHSTKINNKSLGIFMALLMILSLMIGDYIKGEWKGYMRKVLKEKEVIKNG